MPLSKKILLKQTKKKKCNSNESSFYKHHKNLDLKPSTVSNTRDIDKINILSVISVMQNKGGLSWNFTRR